MAGQGTPSVTRADLASAYQRVDAWLMAHPVDSATRVRANRAFDQSTLAFFGGRTGESVRTLHALAASLMVDSAARPALEALFAVRVAGASRVARRGARNATLQLERVLPSATPSRLDVRVLDARQRRVFAGAVALDTGMASARVVGDSVGLQRLAAGRYTVVGRAEGTPEVVLGTVDLAPDDPDSVRVRLTAATATLDSAALPQAVAAFRARLANLVRVPAPDKSAQFLSDPAALATALEREAAALRAGRDPYAGLAADHWRVVVGPGGRAMPLRVIPPPSLAGPMPVVIALHGAGGDENMFPDAYGAGEVVRQARARGALVLSPATTVFGRDPAMLDSVLAVMGRAYALDTTRVYLVGHSAGAAAAYGAVVARPTRIAASVLLAGAGRPPAAGVAVPPSLWLAADIDPVIPPSRIAPAADASRAAGASVEYRVQPGYGHTLVVGPSLAEAFAFLFSHQRGRQP
jgi:predicted esterase